MIRRFLVLLALLATGCSDFDLDDRRIAATDEYALRQQRCEVVDREAVATGEVTNHSGAANGFAVIVRFLDGDVDLGRPQTVEHPEHLADGESWSWELSLPLEPGDDPDRLRCNVIQVVIGQDV